MVIALVPSIILSIVLSVVLTAVLNAMLHLSLFSATILGIVCFFGVLALFRMMKPV